MDDASNTTPEDGANNADPNQASDANGADAPADAQQDPPASELDTVTAERDKLRDQLLRTAADFDNYRKRTRRELEDARARGQHDVVRDLLPVFDNLERALSAAQPAGGEPVSDAGPVIEGVRMVHKLFEDTAERMGLLRIKTVGERFDPAIHEAIQQKESDEQPPGTILSEVVPGYRFGERLVRAAMVVVARKPAAPQPSDPPAAAAAEAKSEPAPGQSAPPPSYPPPSSVAPSDRPPSNRPASSRPPPPSKLPPRKSSRPPASAAPQPPTDDTDDSEKKGS